MEGRSDMAAYKSGARGLHNMIPVPQGGLVRRPGTRFAANVMDHTKESWLLPFVASSSAAYIMEFTDYKVRFFKDEGTLLYSDVTYRPVDVNTVASQIEVQGHGFYHGQKIKLKSATTPPGGVSLGTTYYVVLPESVRVVSQANTTGLYTAEANHNLAIEMGPYRIYHEVNNNMPSHGIKYFVEETAAATTFKLETVKGAGAPPAPAAAATGPMALVPLRDAVANTFRLATDPKDLYGSLVPISSAGSGGVFGTFADEVVTLDTPWTVEDAKLLQTSQSADTMLFFHRDHPPFELVRLNTAAFMLEREVFQDGPYGPLAPLGTGVKQVIGVANNNDGEVARVDCDVVFFQGTDSGLPFRMRKDDQNDTTNDDSALKWASGTIERIEGSNACFLAPRCGFFDSPGGGTTLNIPTHGFGAGEIVWIRQGDGALPAELSERTPYYVLVPDANNIELETSVGGGAITFTPSTGTAHKIISGWLRCVDQNSGAPLPHGLTDGQDWCGVWGLGDLPVGMNVGYAYRIVEIDANTLKLTDRDDADIPLRSAGSGKFWINAPPPDGKVSARVRWDFISPVSGFTNSVWGWRIGAWGARNGWPGAGTFFEQRLVAGGSESEPNRIWGSESANFTSFAPDQKTGTETKPSSSARTVTDASSFSYQLVGSGKIDLIRWIIPTTILMAATNSGIFQISASTNREALTASNLNADIVSRHGTADVMPVISNAEILYVGFQNTQILAAAFDATRDAFNPESITGHADHIITRNLPVLQLAFQNEPWGVCWAVRGDKKLIGCTFSRNQSLAAWHHHELGGSTDESDWGEVESIAAVPSEEPRYEQLWMVVKRKINGQNVRFIEFLTNRFEIDDDQDDAFQVDAGPAPYSGAAVKTLSGLDHLEGETVDVWGDGAMQPQKVVSGGAVTVDEVSKASVGLPYNYDFETLPLEAMLDQVQTLQGHTKRIVDLFFYVAHSLGGSIGRGDDFEVIEYRSPSHLMDQRVPLFTGRVDLMPLLNWIDREAVINFRGTGAAPFHLTHMVARIEHTGR
jgi:hypothetical protein